MSVEIVKGKANESVYGTKTCYTVWVRGNYSTLKSFSSKSEAESYANYLEKYAK